MSRTNRLTALSAVALGAVVLLLTAAALRKIWGADFWWQYATGRLVAEHGIPQQDTFSYTRVGHPWIELRWLYCLALYHLQELAGAGGVVVAKWATLLASFSLVTAPVFSRRTGTLAAGVAAVAILAASQRFFVRPELVTYLMFALFLWVIHRFRRGGGRMLFVLPVLQVIWTNSHTLFIFGPLLVGLLAIVTGGRLLLGGESGGPSATIRHRFRLSAVAFGLTALACLLNPYGLKGLVFPLQLYEEIRGSAFKDTIGEFRSPFTFEQGYTALLYYRALIGLCVASAIINLRRLDPFWTILLVAQLYLSALAIRNIPLFSLAAVPFVVHNFRSSSLWTHRRVSPWLPRIEVAGALAVIALALATSWDLATNRFHVRQHDTNQFGLGLAQHRFPEEAVRFLRENAMAGPIFHTMREGAYLLAHGHPVFIDPRLEVYGEEHYSRYIQTVGGGAGWRDTLRFHGVRAVLLGLGTPLVETMLATRDWVPVHFDECTVLFTRAGPGLPAPLRTEEDFGRHTTDVRRRLPRPRPHGEIGWWDRVVSPKPYIRLADFLVAAGHPGLARPFLEDALEIDPDDSETVRSAAWVLGATGDRAAAVAMLESGLRRWPDDAWMQFQLGVHYYNAGRIEDAGPLVERSLAGDRTNPTAWYLQAQIHAARGDYPAALRAIQQALTLDPTNVPFQRARDSYRSQAQGG